MGDSVWDTPSLRDIFDETDSTYLYLCTLLTIILALIIQSLLYFRYLRGVKLGTHEDFMITWMYKMIVSLPVCVVIYCFMSIVMLKLGVILRPVLEVIEAGALFLLFEVYEEILGGKERMIRNLQAQEEEHNVFAMAPPCCCLGALFCKTKVFDEEVHEWMTFLAKQFCFTVPMVAFVEAICIILEEEDGIVYKLALIVKGLSILFCIWAIVMIEEIVAPEISGSQVSRYKLIMKFVSIKFTLLCVTIQPVVFQAIEFPKIGAFEDGGSRLVIFLLSLAAESFLLAFLIHTAYPSAEIKDIRARLNDQSGESSEPAYANKTPVPLKDKNEKSALEDPENKDYGTQEDQGEELLLSGGLVDLKSAAWPCFELGLWKHIFQGERL